MSQQRHFVRGLLSNKKAESYNSQVKTVSWIIHKKERTIIFPQLWKRHIPRWLDLEILNERFKVDRERTWVWLEFHDWLDNNGQTGNDSDFFTWIWQSFSNVQSSPLNCLYPSTYPSISPAVHPSLISSFCSSVYLSIHPSVCPTVQIYHSGLNQILANNF